SVASRTSEWAARRARRWIAWRRPRAPRAAWRSVRPIRASPSATGRSCAIPTATSSSSRTGRRWVSPSRERRRRARRRTPRAAHGARRRTDVRQASPPAAGARHVGCTSEAFAEASMAYVHYDRLSALDATFLAIEDENVHMHVGAVAIFDAKPLTRPDGGLDFARIRALAGPVLARSQRFRQRLASVPLVGQPVWVDDEHFQLDYHLRHT